MGVEGVEGYAIGSVVVSPRRGEWVSVGEGVGGDLWWGRGEVQFQEVELRFLGNDLIDVRGE